MHPCLPIGQLVKKNHVSSVQLRRFVRVFIKTVSWITFGGTLSMAILCVRRGIDHLPSSSMLRGLPGNRGLLAAVRDGVVGFLQC